MKRALFLVLAVVIAACTPVAAAPARAQERDCLSDRQIYSAVEQGQLSPLEDVLRSNGIDRSTEVLSVEVCNAGAGLAYYVGVIDAYGEAKTLVLPAFQ